MTRWGKRFVCVLMTAILAVFLFSNPVLARSGCCSWHGGVCGCECCDGTPLSATCAPYYPGCGGGYYTPPPTCPLNSYYDSISDSCKCYSGYVASGSRCISQDEYCQNLYGFNSRYNILTDTCECRYGYVFDNSKCISGNQYCWNKYGYNSSYNSINKNCECNYGYVFNKSGTQCISKDAWCREKLGFGSEYSLLKDTCVCSSGYKYDGSGCVIGVTVYEPPLQHILLLPTSRPTPTPKPKPSPTPTSTPVPTLSPTPTPVQSPSPTQTPEVLGEKAKESTGGSGWLALLLLLPIAVGSFLLIKRRKK